MVSSVQRRGAQRGLRRSPEHLAAAPLLPVEWRHVDDDVSDLRCVRHQHTSAFLEPALLYVLVPEVSEPAEQTDEPDRHERRHGQPRGVVCGQLNLNEPYMANA